MSDRAEDDYDRDRRAGVPATHGLLSDAELAALPSCPWYDHADIQRAHYIANRTVLLEHARMGRPVVVSRDGKVVHVPPAEVFSWYGLDEFGRPAG